MIRSSPRRPSRAASKSRLETLTTWAVPAFWPRAAGAARASAAAATARSLSARMGTSDVDLVPEDITDREDDLRGLGRIARAVLPAKGRREVRRHGLELQARAERQAGMGR